MKKEMILKSVMLAFIAMSAVNVCGQTTWVYSYDDTGNRTQRVVDTGAKARQRAASPNNLINSREIVAEASGYSCYGCSIPKHLSLDCLKLLEATLL